MTQTPRQSRVPVERGAGNGGSSARQRVLARRRNALVGLALAAVATLAAAIVTGSIVLLVLSLLVDVALAGYIAMLLQIKQTAARQGSRHGRWEDNQQVRVVSR